MAVAEKISRKAAVAATHEGVEAAKADKGVSACPYDAYGDIAEDFQRHHWLEGYRSVAESG